MQINDTTIKAKLEKIATQLKSLADEISDIDGWPHLDRLFYAIQLAQMEAERQVEDA